MKTTTTTTTNGTTSTCNGYGQFDAGPGTTYAPTPEQQDRASRAAHMAMAKRGDGPAPAAPGTGKPPEPVRVVAATPATPSHEEGAQRLRRRRVTALVIGSGMVLATSALAANSQLSALLRKAREGLGSPFDGGPAMPSIPFKWDKALSLAREYAPHASLIGSAVTALGSAVYTVRKEKELSGLADKDSDEGKKLKARIGYGRLITAAGTVAMVASLAALVRKVEAKMPSEDGTLIPVQPAPQRGRRTRRRR